MAKTIFISTGEVSGDLITSYLIRELLLLDPKLKIIAIGGREVAATGVDMVFDSTELGAIGIFECLPLIRKYFALKRTMKATVNKTKPDLAVLIDAYGFNSGLAVQFKKREVPAICFIPSPDWAFNKLSGLMGKLMSCTQRIICIFPQSARYYRSVGAQAMFLGHPLLDMVADTPSQEQARKNLGLPLQASIVALMPASRRQETRYILPLVLAAAEKIQLSNPTVHFCLPIVRPDLEQVIRKRCQRSKVRNLHFSFSSGASVIAAADVLVCKSGTVNVEAAVIGTPQVVFYKLNRLTWWVAKYILRMPHPSFISPVNLLANKVVVPEFLQHKATADAIEKEVTQVLLNPQRRQQYQDDYALVRNKMGQTGVFTRVANDILNFMNNRCSKE